MSEPARYDRHLLIQRMKARMESSGHRAVFAAAVTPLASIVGSG
jgi:hypothetical protein